MVNWQEPDYTSLLNRYFELTDYQERSEFLITNLHDENYFCQFIENMISMFQDKKLIDLALFKKITNPNNEWIDGVSSLEKAGHQDLAELMRPAADLIETDVISPEEAEEKCTPYKGKMPESLEPYRDQISNWNAIKEPFGWTYCANLVAGWSSADEIDHHVMGYTIKKVAKGLSEMVECDCSWCGRHIELAGKVNRQKIK